MSENVHITQLAHSTSRFFSRGVVAFAVLLVLTACAEPEPRPVGELLRKGDVFLDPDTFEPYSGTVFATFDDQPLVIAQRLSLRDGAYDGPYEDYFENRQLSAKEMYENGVKHGPYQWYFENGRIFEEGTYHEGHLDGSYRAYWDSGDLYEDGTYNHGEFEGPRKWYLSGQLIELVTYDNGIIDGPYERYSEDGTLDMQGILLSGSPCGVWKEGPATVRYPACDEMATD